jgi:hypothetical protein
MNEMERALYLRRLTEQSARIKAAASRQHSLGGRLAKFLRSIASKLDGNQR